MRAPPKDTVVAMVKDAWNSVSRETIINSFRACGLTTHDVNEIHCTKADCLASAARADLLGWQPSQAGPSTEDSESDSSSSSDTDASDEDEVIDEDEGFLL